MGTVEFRTVFDSPLHRALQAFEVGANVLHQNGHARKITIFEFLTIVGLLARHFCRAMHHIIIGTGDCYVGSSGVKIKTELFAATAKKMLYRRGVKMLEATVVKIKTELFVVLVAKH